MISKTLSRCATRPGFFSVLCALALAMPAGQAEDVASAYRRFTTQRGETFYAMVESKADTSVRFKLQTGKVREIRISDLSEPDQQFVRKWTKFKDQLMTSKEFAKLTIKELLELRGYQSFEFDIKGNHIFVEGIVNGETMTMMVDTGASTSLFHVDASARAKLEVGPYDQKIRGVGGEAPAAVTKVPEIKLGDVTIRSRKLLTADIFKYHGGKGDYDAIFGADFLRELDAVISYREGRMFLKPENVAQPGEKPKTGIQAEFRRWTKADGGNFVAALDDKNEKEAVFRFQNGQKAPLAIEKLAEADQTVVAKWNKLRDSIAKNSEFATLTVKELLELRNYQSFVYRLGGNHVYVDGFVHNGKKNSKCVFLIDTGAFGGVLHINYANKIGLEVGPMDQKIFGIGGEAPAALTPVPSLTLGDAVIENRILLSADLFKDAGIPEELRDYDAIFGADFMRELDAVVNYKEARIFLRPDLSDQPKTPEGQKPEEGKSE